jgi:hypothetical protein
LFLVDIGRYKIAVVKWDVVDYVADELPDFVDFSNFQVTPVDEVLSVACSLIDVFHFHFNVSKLKGSS